MKHLLRTALPLLLCLSLFLLLIPAAFADESAPFVLPVLPDGHPEDHTPPVSSFQFEASETEEFLSDLPYYRDRVSITVTQSGDYFSGVTWTASTTGGSGQYSYEFILVEPAEKDGKHVYYYVAGQNDGSSVFSHVFIENGEYELWVDVTDTLEQFSQRETLEISVHAAGNDPLEFSVSTSGQYFTQPTTWTVNAIGGSGDYQYYMELHLLGLGLDASTVSYNHGPKADNTLTYQLLASGDYELRVWVTDTGKNIQKSKSFPFTASSPSYPSVPEKVNALVADAAAAGCADDFETAVWLHDWLIYHANYDLTYSHYGPDGVLLGATGVCDSYSKAFMLLLKAANIEADRAVNAEHSWNVIQVGGDWYYVDTTWDDPVASGSSAPGGLEHHHYFCIPDEILGMDHPNYDSPHTCSSYEYNYYAQNGEGARWTDSFASDVESALHNGNIVFTVNLPASYSVEGRTYSGSDKPVVVLAENVLLMLAQRRNYHYDAQIVPLRISKALSSDTFVHVTVQTAGRTLVLPDHLSHIGAEAFENASSFMAVEIPTTVTRIDSAAFAGCQELWYVLIPSSVVTFGDNIFDKGNGHLTLFVEEGSPAAQYASVNGLKYQYTSN